MVPSPYAPGLRGDPSSQHGAGTEGRLGLLGPSHLTLWDRAQPTQPCSPRCLLASPRCGSAGAIASPCRFGGEPVPHHLVPAALASRLHPRLPHRRPLLLGRAGRCRCFCHRGDPQRVGVGLPPRLPLPLQLRVGQAQPHQVTPGSTAHLGLQPPRRAPGKLGQTGPGVLQLLSPMGPSESQFSGGFL